MNIFNIFNEVIDMSGIDMSGIDMSGIDMSGIGMSGIGMSGIYIPKSNKIKQNSRNIK